MLKKIQWIWVENQTFFLPIIRMAPDLFCPLNISLTKWIKNQQVNRTCCQQLAGFTGSFDFSPYQILYQQPAMVSPEPVCIWKEGDKFKTLPYTFVL
jgi:hypothetical protein